MEITLPLRPDLWLALTSGAVDGGAYPTARLQKGLRLVHAGQDLAEEAVGFGVPVLKRGLQTIFPGEVELTQSGAGSLQVVTANYRLNLEERLARPGAMSVRIRWLYDLKNLLAALMRHCAPLRDPLTSLSNTLRRASGWETQFEASDVAANVLVTYAIDPQSGVIRVEAAAPGLLEKGVTEVIVMNEQGARPFDHYRDSGGASQRGAAIGCWDEVTAQEASFVSDAHCLMFTLWQVNGARLYRGRELIGSRLAWAGFGYSFPPAQERISYQLKIEAIA